MLSGLITSRVKTKRARTGQKKTKEYRENNNN